MSRTALLACLLLLGALVLAATLPRRSPRPLFAADPRPVLHIAHTLLQSGAREALATLARDYEQLTAAAGQPCRVELLAIPERAYPQWLRTQLIGGTAPEIVMLNPQGDDALNVRYFLPLSDAVGLPNPHNAGTPLADQPWRDTFLDGLDNAGFNFRLGEHFAVPLSVNPTRLFVNRALLAQVLASPAGTTLQPQLSPDGLPRDFRAFLATCEAFRAYARAHRLPLVPIAGSQFNAPLLLDRLFTSQTQRLNHDPAWLGQAFPQASVMPMLGALVTGPVGPRHPQFQAGFQLMRDVGQYFQPGFAQQNRDDATFLFCQGRSLFIAANAWDATGFTDLIAGQFTFSVFPPPLPHRTDPQYGPNLLGERTEADFFPTGTFGIVSFHSEAQQARALDFLHYLTSLRGNERFAALSGWLPSVSAAAVPPSAQDFSPLLTGYAAGPIHHINDTELRALIDRHLHHLIGETGSLATFTDQLTARWMPTVLESSARTFNRVGANLARQDSLIAAHRQLATAHPTQAPRARQRLDSLVDASLGLEADWHFYQMQIKAATRRAP